MRTRSSETRPTRRTRSSGPDAGWRSFEYAVPVFAHVRAESADASDQDLRSLLGLVERDKAVQPEVDAIVAAGIDVVTTVNVSALESLHDVVFEIGPDECVTYISPTVASLSDAGPEEYVGRPFRDFIYPDDLPAEEAHHLKIGLEAVVSLQRIVYQSFVEQG